MVYTLFFPEHSISFFTSISKHSLFFPIHTYRCKVRTLSLNVPLVMIMYMLVSKSPVHKNPGGSNCQSVCPVPNHTGQHCSATVEDTLVSLSLSAPRQKATMHMIMTRGIAVTQRNPNCNWNKHITHSCSC